MRIPPQTGSLAHYLREITSTPLLDPEEEQQLAREIRCAHETWLEHLFAIPALAAAVVERWNELRAAGRTPASLVEGDSETSADARNRKLARTFRRLERLVDERAGLGSGEEAAAVEARIARALAQVRPGIRALEELGREVRAQPTRWARRVGMGPTRLRRQLERADAAHADFVASRERFVRANTRLVVHIAKGYGGRGLSLEDLVQDGNLGLLRAVEKFDPTRGLRFSTYAAFWIRQAVQRGIQARGRPVRVPAGVEDALRKLTRVEQTRRAQTGEASPPPSLRSLGAIDTQRALGALRQSVSLDAQRGDLEPLIHSLRDPDVRELEDALESRERSEQARALVEDLDARDRRIIESRFGLHGHAPRTLDHIATELGISRERVRQLEANALQRLRESAIERGLADPSESQSA